MIHTQCSDCGILLTIENVYAAKSKRCKLCQIKVERSRYHRRKLKYKHLRASQRNEIDPREYGILPSGGKVPKAFHD